MFLDFNSNFPIPKQQGYETFQIAIQGDVPPQFKPMVKMKKKEKVLYNPLAFYIENLKLKIETENKSEEMVEKEKEEIVKKSDI